MDLRNRGKWALSQHEKTSFSLKSQVQVFTKFRDKVQKTIIPHPIKQYQVL